MEIKLDENKTLYEFVELLAAGAGCSVSELAARARVPRGSLEYWKKPMPKTLRSLFKLAKAAEKAPENLEF